MKFIHNKKSIYEKVIFCRVFEDKIYSLIQDKKITFPVYLSAGQEFISAIISELTKDIEKKQIFIQHRGHSTYLNFGGCPLELMRELLGYFNGCSGGMAGSASISSQKANIYGHDGLMGSQVPIAIGMCYANNNPTIVFMGDASCEEDYVLGALGWAATKNLPILFVVEDNNLSILTEKKIRRNWSIVDVAISMGIKSYHITDSIRDFEKQDINLDLSKPMLLNIETVRKYWHAGAGKDGDRQTRLEKEKEKYYSIYDFYSMEQKAISKVEKIWTQILEQQ